MMTIKVSARSPSTSRRLYFLVAFLVISTLQTYCEGKGGLSENPDFQACLSRASTNKRRCGLEGKCSYNIHWRDEDGRVYDDEDDEGDMDGPNRISGYILILSNGLDKDVVFCVESLDYGGEPVPDDDYKRSATKVSNRTMRNSRWFGTDRFNETISRRRTLDDDFDCYYILKNSYRYINNLPSTPHVVRLLVPNIPVKNWIEFLEAGVNRSDLDAVQTIQTPDDMCSEHAACSMLKDTCIRYSEGEPYDAPECNRILSFCGAMGNTDDKASRNACFSDCIATYYKDALKGDQRIDADAMMSYAIICGLEDSDMDCACDSSKMVALIALASVLGALIICTICYMCKIKGQLARVVQRDGGMGGKGVNNTDDMFSSVFTEYNG